MGVDKGGEGFTLPNVLSAGTRLECSFGITSLSEFFPGGEPTWGRPRLRRSRPAGAWEPARAPGAPPSPPGYQRSAGWLEPVLPQYTLISRKLLKLLWDLPGAPAPDNAQDNNCKPAG